MKHFQKGNSIRMSAKFTDWDDVPRDPDLVKFMVYDVDYIKLSEVVMAPANHVTIGEYVYYYVPEGSGTIFVEWYGEMDGLPSLRRERIEIRTV